MANEAGQENPFNIVWYWYLTGEKRGDFPRSIELELKVERLVYSILPGTPRCFECTAPLSGLGNLILKPFGVRRATFSPRLCNVCEKIVRKKEGGAEVELSMLFADVRGSTSLAASSSTSEFKALIQQFYKVASDVLVEYEGMVNRLMGDQVIGLFVPRFAGSRHANVAIDAAQTLLRATGHEDPQGPWIPVGVGVHTGVAYVGVVGSKDGVNEIAVLGNAANLTARLSSRAADGEILISEEAAASAGMDGSGLESRVLELKGIDKSVPVRIMKVEPANKNR